MFSQVTFFDNESEYYQPKYYLFIGGYVDEKIYSEYDRAMYLAGKPDNDAKFVAIADWAKANMAPLYY